MIKIYKNNEITNKEIKFLKRITKKRYPKEIYQDYFKNLNSLNDLVRLHNTYNEEEILVIGTNWFLCYSIDLGNVRLLEWVSLDDNNKIMQTIEMMKVFKQILIQNKDKIFSADMRHDSSYKLYKNLLEKNYFTEITHEYTIDCSAPKHIHNLKEKYLKKYKSLKHFLESSEAYNDQEHHKYILHQIRFLLNDEFIKRYNKSPKKLIK